MRMPRFVLMLCILALTVCSALAGTARAAIDRFGRAFADTFAPATNPLALAGVPNTPMFIGGQALARSTQQGLRHEAGVSRRSADRKV